MTSTANLTLPSLLIHCDWSISPARRQLSKATLQGSSYTVHDPEPVGPLETLISRIATFRTPTGSALVGFDFPIGIPVHYARANQLLAFRNLLQRLALREWSSFYTVCKNQEEITQRRPFYPHGPGNKRQSHLLRALGAEDINQLRRSCEQAQPDRRAANPLFWTLGASQAGKGAIVGWRDLIIPALDKNEIKLWPFDGPLPDLLQPCSIVVAETYPTQYHQALLGESLIGKGKQKTRKKFSQHLFSWASKHSVILTPALAETIRDGFPQGDDAFDAVLGLFGMIQLTQTYNPQLHEPTNPTIRNIEGWILGQPTVRQPAS